MEEILHAGGVVTLTATGASMRPTIRGGTDRVLLKRIDRCLRRLDILLCRRQDGTYVLHRIVTIHPNGFAIRGDNQLGAERGIQPSQVMAVLIGFYRGTRYISCQSFAYRAFSWIWTFLYPARALYYLTRTKISAGRNEVNN